MPRGGAVTRDPAAAPALAATAPAFRRMLPAALLLLGLMFAGCGDDSSGPAPGAAPSTLSFTLNDSINVAFEGEAAWPASGTGVIARLDSTGTSLVIAAYRQTSGKGALGPEPRFTFTYLRIDEASGIAAGPHLPDAAFFGQDLALDDIDSLAYVGVYGTFVISAISADRVAGTFSGVAMRPSDSAVVAIGGGTFDAALATGTLPFEDTSSSGGTIAIAVGTGTTPSYAWAGGPVYALGVARVASPSTLAWGIVTAGADSIASAVVHGSAPAGASVVAGGETVLTPGVAYRITVSRINGEFGFATFTP